MARKSRHSVSRKRKYTRKHKTHRHKTHNKRHHRKGGALTGASLTYNLADSWPSKMSMGQGGDYLKYHEGQHGGSHMAGAPLSALDGQMLDPALRGPAHLAGLDGAFRDIAGLKDQAGGRRKRKGSRKNRSARRDKKKGSRKNRKATRRDKKGSRKSRSRRTRRSRGGALGYAPFPSGGMLLKGDDYARAGLHPSYINGGIEAEAAAARASM